MDKETETTSAVAKAYDPNGLQLYDKPFKFQSIDIARTLRALVMATGRDTMNVFDLTQLRVPAGGATQWRKGAERVDHVDGVILDHHVARTFWRKRYGDGDPTFPDCQSDDGIVGVGDPGGACATCPMAQFVDGKASACRTTHRVFILPVDASLPLMIPAPSLSLKPLRDYLKRLARDFDAFPWSVVTRFSLEGYERNKNLVSRMVMTPLYRVTSETEEALEQYATALRAVTKSATPPQLAQTAGQTPSPATTSQQARPLFENVDEDEDDIP